MDSTAPKDIRKWEQTREKGKLRFISQTGLGWAVPMFVVMTFFVNNQGDGLPSPGMIALSAVIWAIGGACFGFAMWKVGERKYQKYLASK